MLDSLLYGKMQLRIVFVEMAAGYIMVPQLPQARVAHDCSLIIYV